MENHYSKYVVILDSNALRDQQWIKETLFNDIDSMLNERLADVEFRVTGMVQKEWLHNYSKKAREFHSNARRFISSLREMGFNHDEPKKSDEVEIEKTGIGVLKKHKIFEIEIPYERIDWKELVERAAKHELPFQPDSDKGMKDAIHALTVSDYVSRSRRNRRVVLVSYDKKLREHFAEMFADKDIDIYPTLGEFASQLRLKSQELEGDLQAKARAAFSTGDDSVLEQFDVYQKIIDHYQAKYPDGDAFRNHALTLEASKLKSSTLIPNDKQWQPLDNSFTIGHTTFIKRRGTRLYWRTRIVFKQAYALSTYNDFDGMVLNNPTAIIHTVLYDIDWAARASASRDIIAKRFNELVESDEYIEAEPFAGIDHRTGTTYLSREKPPVPNGTYSQTLYRALTQINEQSQQFNKVINENPELKRSIELAKEISAQMKKVTDPLSSEDKS